MTFEDAILLIKQELERAEKLHPVWPKCMVRRAAYMVEEAGECLQAANSYEDSQSKILKQEFKENARIEAIQSGAMSLRFLMSLGD